MSQPDDYLKDGSRGRKMSGVRRLDRDKTKFQAMRAPLFPVPSIVMKTSPTSARGNSRQLRLPRTSYRAILVAALLPSVLSAQSSFTWQQIKDKFEAGNPSLGAAQLSINESRAAEITAYRSEEHTSELQSPCN